MRVEWDSSLDSSNFDVSLLNDGSQVRMVAPIHEGGSLPPCLHNERAYDDKIKDTHLLSCHPLER